MNERIRPLYYECQDESQSTEECYLKFAELIIRICMACSTWVGKMNTNSCEPIHTAQAINQRIKQQLGVEE